MKLMKEKKILKMNIENLLEGLIFILIGLAGTIYGISERTEKEYDLSASNFRLIFFSICLIIVGFYWIFK